MYIIIGAVHPDRCLTGKQTLRCLGWAAAERAKAARRRRASRVPAFVYASSGAGVGWGKGFDSWIPYQKLINLLVSIQTIETPMFWRKSCSKMETKVTRSNLRFGSLLDRTQDSWCSINRTKHQVGVHPYFRMVQTSLIRAYGRCLPDAAEINKKSGEIG